MIDTQNILPHTALYKSAVESYENAVGIDRLKLQVKIYNIAVRIFTCATLVYFVGLLAYALTHIHRLEPLVLIGGLGLGLNLVVRAVSGFFFDFKLQRFEVYMLLKKITAHTEDSFEYKEGVRQLQDIYRGHQVRERKYAPFNTPLFEATQDYLSPINMHHLKLFCGVDFVPVLNPS